jgi:hypothetical protein
VGVAIRVNHEDSIVRKGFIFDPVTRKAVYVHVTKGELRQPDYSRGPHTHATSSRLLSYRSCVQTELSGKRPGNRRAAREAFTAAARRCSGRA